ncbi:type II secretion system protein M [Pseudalkalibacillus berkeleyi]|uniref:Type II secretion system protein M n=1 Tax=Pseudalkalibacillus berkeleyi TaxID=1069813 RepID=A0ABS9H225_9BACL|nr:type II secretion system protein M [Pseudalkalibacillus berkeleyi]MCF6138101.1 type II secretion system protein M [Pseudalkalibacillus berkeleyi]
MSTVPSQKRLLALLSFILVLVLIASYVWLVHPSFAHIEQLEKDIKNEKTLIQATKVKLKEKSAEESDIAFSLPSYPATDQIVLHLRNAEKEASSEIRNLSFEENQGEDEEKQGEQTVTSSQLQPLTFSLEVSSPNIESVKKFVSTLESSERLYKVLKLDLTAASSEEEKAPIIYTIDLETYYQ